MKHDKHVRTLFLGDFLPMLQRSSILQGETHAFDFPWILPAWFEGDHDDKHITEQLSAAQERASDLLKATLLDMDQEDEHTSDDDHEDTPLK